MTVHLLFLIPLFAIAHGVIGKIDTQIIGGGFARPGQVPYQVSLQRIRTGTHFCGGVIIGKYYILTAASCVDGVDVNTISANVGLIDLREPHAAVHLIKSSYIHEDYNPDDSWVNDIALLKLQSPIKYSPLVYSVRLRLNQDIPVATKVVASGFGRLSYQGEKTMRLHVVDIKIADQAYCRNLWTEKFQKIYDTQICAKDTIAKKGSCTGDSGGPLTLKNKLIGIDSWGFECGNTVYPEVYTRVSSYIQWIIDRTTDS